MKTLTPILSLVLSVVAIVLAVVALVKPAADLDTAMSKYLSNAGGEITAAIEKHMQNQQVEAAANIIKDYNLSRGDADAPIQFVEFGNYKCPYCHRVQPTVDKLLEQYGDKVHHVFKHMPIDQTSFEGAKALQAATEQGEDKAWRFFGLMWDESALDNDTFVRVAEAADLNIADFNKYRESEEAEQRVQADIADAAALGGSGTPFFVINGQPLSGAQPYEVFEARFKEILGE